jgi:hypothetical protein
MPVSISGTNGVTFPDSSLQAAAASPYVLKNRIINGAMVVDQRNAGASVTPTDTGGRPYNLDRWCTRQSQASKFSIQQSSTAPTGFINSSLITSLSAYSITSSDQFVFIQIVEGLNVSDLAWGTANAATVTLSFQVRSSLTGTFGGSLRNGGADRSYPFSYTINTANTWETKTVTIAGDTSGTWLTTNGIGITVGFGFGVGSTLSGTAGSWAATNYASATGATSVVGTNGATFYITGVQLEQNTSATPFERRLYNQELANCQRYYQTLGYGVASLPVIVAGYSGSGASVGQIKHIVSMRAAPTFSVTGSLQGVDNSLGPLTITATLSTSSADVTRLTFTHGTLTSDAAREYRTANTTSSVNLSAEL